MNRRMPAEWEPQGAVQLTWPHSGTDWAPMLEEIEQVYMTLAQEIVRREQLLVVAAPQCFADDKSRRSMERLEQMGATICRIPTDDTWARDHGFITVEENGHLTLLDFCFNGWGRKFPAEQDNAINARLYDCLRDSHTAAPPHYEPHLDFVLEGGSIESDGRGTVLTTECCLMAPNRNQPLSASQIDERLRRWLGAERIVWLKNGHLEGDDTDGHIDTLVRVAPDDTLIYIEPPAPLDPHHASLSALQEELRQLRTLDGRPYRLLTLPLPRPICEDGQRLPATYANYLVVNGAVLMPTYGQPDLDRRAMGVVAEAFPSREVVGIDCRPVIRQHGSLHCCTMQYYNTLS